MAGISSINARIFPDPLTPLSRSAEAGRTSFPAGRGEGAGADVFQSGLPEQGRVNGQASPLADGCRCSRCARCAAQAYALQEQQFMAGRRGDAGMAPDTAPPAAETGEGAATENSSAESASRETMAAAPPKGADGEPLTPQEVALLMELKKADAAVRAHEQAHLAAAGGLAKGGANFSYRKGPDGRRYAVAGEVGIDTSKGATPEETISRMARVRAAALAPADPSPQDRKVAQAAAMSMSEARGELRLERMEKEGATDVADANAEQSESTSGAAAATTTEQSGSAVSVRGYSVMPSLSRREGAFYRLA